MPGTFPALSFSATQSFKYPVTRKLTKPTTVATFCDFSEQRWNKSVAGSLVEFEWNYSKLSTLDKEAIRTFYAAQGGEFATDWTVTFDGNTYTNCQFIGPFSPRAVGPKLWDLTLRARGVTSFGTAIVHALTSHSEGSPFLINAVAGQPPIGLFVGFPAGLISSFGSWTLQTNTIAIPLAEISTLQVVFSSFSFNGGLAGGNPQNPPDTFLIYDCWVVVTQPGGAQVTMRGTTINTLLSPNGTLVNPGNAIDGDPTTFASITTNVASTLGFGPAFAIANFV